MTFRKYYKKNLSFTRWAFTWTTRTYSIYILWFLFSLFLFKPIHRYCAKILYMSIAFALVWITDIIFWTTWYKLIDNDREKIMFLFNLIWITNVFYHYSKQPKKLFYNKLYFLFQNYLLNINFLHLAKGNILKKYRLLD